MEREVGGWIGMGNTCKPMAVSFQYMTKSTTNKKKKQTIYNKLTANIILNDEKLNNIVNNVNMMDFTKKFTPNIDNKDYF